MGAMVWRNLLLLQINAKIEGVDPLVLPSFEGFEEQKSYFHLHGALIKTKDAPN